MGEVVPVGEGQFRRQAQRGVSGQVFQPRREPLAAFAERQGAQVLALILQKVVGVKDDRGVFQQTLWDFLATDALLQIIEALRCLIAPYQHFAVNDQPVRQEIARAAQFGEGIGDQFLAARPEEMLIIAQDQLPANAVPFPFRMPVRWRTEGGGFIFQSIGEVEGVGARGVGAGVFRLDQGVPGYGIGAPVAHQTMRQFRLFAPCCAGKRAGHQFLRDSDAKPAGDQLVEQKPLCGVEEIPGVDDFWTAVFFGQRCEIAQVVDPVAQVMVALLGCGRQDQGDGFGKISDNRVGLFDEPKRQPRVFRRPFAQARGGYGAFGSATGEQCDGPEPVRLGCLAEVVGQCVDLQACLGGLIDALE